ncbi:MAG: glycosyl hydrolase family 8 [Desulfobacca sp.]|uniref:glycosyl hydrolase family 8 n=1 Tax=Desulfobacca sp. TaxID=2067990 RepID=UPI00404A4B38
MPPNNSLRLKPLPQSSGWVRIFPFLLLLCGLLAACNQLPDPERQLAARLDTVLAASWQFYKVNFIQADGRVVRPENHHDTISEGQAYALLRAVWSNDQATFDRVYGWTETHLSQQQRHGRHLLAWHFGQDQQGQWRLLDGNSATDADLDYALALILAQRRWGQPTGNLPAYQEKALLVLQDILAYSTCRDPWERLWLTPGDWTGCQLPLLLNPSYFFPAAYEVFYWISGDRRWLQLADSAYLGLQLLIRRLGEQSGVGLVPDWFLLQDKEAWGPAPEQSSVFGWDAIRVPWRLGLAGLWFQDKRARDFLAKNFLAFARQQWQAHGRLLAIFTYDGRPLVDYDSPVLYASLVAAALADGDQNLARQAVEKILGFYQEGPDGGFFNRPDDYYGNNWAWFGLATYRGLIVPQW